MRALMWFRSDLRLQDNTALHHACKAADKGVIAVFTTCPKQWIDHDWGSRKVDFVLRSIRALSEALPQLNIPLRLIRVDGFDEVANKLLNLAKRHACEALYFNKEYEVNELRRDREVATLFQEHRRSIHAFTDQLIVDVGCLAHRNRRLVHGIHSIQTQVVRSPERGGAAAGMAEAAPATGSRGQA